MRTMFDVCLTSPPCRYCGQSMSEVDAGGLARRADGSWVGACEKCLRDHGESERQLGLTTCRDFSGLTQ
jgi:hypothetical protein